MMRALCFVEVVCMEKQMIVLDEKISEKEISKEFVLRSPKIQREASGLIVDRG
jgi:hypothetical protein